MAENTPSFYLLTCRGSGHGMGHWKRSQTLLEELRSRGMNAQLLFPAEEDSWRDQIISPPSSSCFVVDLRALGEDDFLFIRSRGALVGLDEGGPRRSDFDLLADYLPGLSGEAPNFYVQLPRESLVTEGEESSAAGGVLISFGGEDPAQLTLPAAQCLHSLSREPERSEPLEALLRGGITVVKGPLAGFDEGSLPRGIDCLSAPSSLANTMAEASLVVTSWGMTLWEAALAARPVVIINPTPYHDSLCRRLGLPHLRAGDSPTPRRLRKLLAQAPEVPRLIQHWEAAHPRRNLAAVLAGLPLRSLTAKRRLPVFPGVDTPHDTPSAAVVYRETHRNFRYQAPEGFLFLQPLEPVGVDYGPAYFDEEYRAQYGRSYLEDFESIKEMGRSRLGVIHRFMGPGKGRKALDLGCAYGPFLEACREAGWSPEGVDISEAAVAYLRETRGIPAVQSSLEAWEPASSYDVITLWYVLEHLEDPVSLLEKIKGALTPGGMVAISTPSYRGVTGLFQRERFLTQSPRDHYLLLDPRSLKAILESRGFRVVKVRQRGIHSSRFAGASALIPRPLRPAAAHLLGWGDTFEIFARLETGKGTL